MLDRRTLRLLFLAMVVLMSIWLIRIVLFPEHSREYREADSQRYVFTQPVRDEVLPPLPTDKNARSRINVLRADKVEKLSNDVRCVPLQTAGAKPICIDTKDKFIGPAIAGSGAWERQVWNPMVKLLNGDPELCLIDIGANIGVFTISVAAMGRRVVAVEAFYENIQRMSESLRMGGLTDKVTIVYNAVSDIYEDVFFWKPDDNPGGTHTLSKGVTLGPNKPVFRGEHSSVPTIYLNDLVNILPFNKAIIKIDIEGYENKAFKKVELLLDSVNIKAIFMEFTFVKASDDVLNIVRVLRIRGYKPHTLGFQELKGGNTRAELGPWPGDIVWIKKAEPDVKATEKPKVVEKEKTPENALNPKTEQQKPGSRDIVQTSVKVDLGNGFNINILDPKTVPSLSNYVNCVRLRTAADKLICTDTRDKFIGPSIVGSGAWEPHIWAKMSEFLKMDDELGLIDIGANIGVFTLSAAAMGRQVLAVEAFYENIQRLSESLRLGKLTDKVSLVYNAVSDVYEYVHFWKPDDNPGGTHTLSEGVTLSPQQRDWQGDHAKVGTIFLDDLVRVARFKKAIMKVDIEGFENRAFKKIEKLLDGIDVRALFMEWQFVKASPDCLNIRKIMTDRQYQAKDMNLNNLVGATLEEVQKWPGDIIWVKEGKL